MRGSYTLSVGREFYCRCRSNIGRQVRSSPGFLRLYSSDATTPKLQVIILGISFASCWERFEICEIHCQKSFLSMMLKLVGRCAHLHHGSGRLAMAKLDIRSKPAVGETRVLSLISRDLHIGPQPKTTCALQTRKPLRM